MYRFIRLICATYRLKLENEQVWFDEIERGNTILLCCWHQQFFAAIRHFKKYKRWKPSIMISASKDGDLIASVAEKTGWRTIRGSSSRQARAALLGIIRELKKSPLGVHIVDGPRGPMGQIKPGLVFLAQANSAKIVPFHITANKAWHFNSWDYFMIPKPFTKVTIHFERPYTPDKKTPHEEHDNKLTEIMRPHLIWPPADSDKTYRANRQ